MCSTEMRFRNFQKTESSQHQHLMLCFADDFQMAIGAQTCFIWGPRRETSAKAFGTLANALPEEMLGDLADAISMHCDLQVYSYSTEPISDDESI